MRRLTIAHLTTVDMSLALLLGVELAEAVAAGHEVLGVSAPGPYVPRVEALGVRHVPVPSLTRSWSVGGDARAARELWQVLRREEPDVLHTHTPKAGVLGRVLGRAVGVPVVVDTCHGLWAPSAASGPRARAVRAAVLAVESTAARLAHAELFQNAEDLATLRRWGLPAGRSRLVGNGTDLSRFGPDPAVRAAVRAELGVADGVVLVGGIGRLVAEKGLRELGAAARALRERAAGGTGPPVDVVWVGPPDPEKPDAVSDAVAGVRLLGEQRDVERYLAALDVFVLPSYREGFSRSGMEAAATGLPLVLSDVRGCREVGRHEQEALLVPAADAEALTCALTRLVDDPGLRSRLGAAARVRALAEFDQRAVAAVSRRTYDAVAARRGLPWAGAASGLTPSRPARSPPPR